MNEEEKNKEDYKKYLGIVLIFAAIQVIIGSFQLIQSSLNSTVISAKYFGYFGALVIPLTMWYMYTRVKNDK